MQRCDREIVDGSAAVGRRREGSKDAAGAGSWRRRATAAAGTLPGLPCARPPGQPPPASIHPIEHAPRARVAGKEAAAFAKKHPDPGKLLCDERPQLGGGGTGAGEREASRQAALLLLPGQQHCAAAASWSPGAPVCFNLPAQEVVGSLASSSLLLLDIDQATGVSQTQSRSGRARASACTACAWP